MAKSLSHLTCLTSLNLSETVLPVVEATTLLRALPPSLYVLDLSGNFGELTKLSKKSKKDEAKNVTLVHHVSKKIPVEEHFLEIAKFLTTNTHIKSLALRGTTKIYLGQKLTPFFSMF